MDIEAFLEAYPTIPASATVAMPWYPHVNMKSGRHTLDELAQAHPNTLGELKQQGRLAGFNSTTSGLLPNPEFPIIRVRYFSAVAAVNILAMAGHKEIHTIGVDGGNQYAPMFDTKDLLANGRKNFDIQSTEFALTADKFGLRIIPV